jgi:hypothetical protein
VNTPEPLPINDAATPELDINNEPVIVSLPLILNEPVTTPLTLNEPVIRTEPVKL